MKLLTVLLFIFISKLVLSQEEELHIQAQIIDEEKNPVEDVYIINYRNQKRFISNQNGVFDLFLLPGDSLIVTHISYLSKKIRAFDLMANPVVQLKRDTINIEEVRISPDEKTDYQRAEENLSFLSEVNFPKFEKIARETQPVYQIVTEYNKLMRSDATSITIFRSSPSGMLKKATKKVKHRKKSKQYFKKKDLKKTIPKS